MKITLANPGMMNITGPQGETYIGGSQEWYHDRWQRISGCGPTAASNLVWYMARPKPAVPSHINGGADHYMELQNEMFSYVTPGMQGVNSSSIFTRGVENYGRKHDLRITSHVVEIPGKPSKQPDADELRNFVAEALQSDAPVAFLNLSNGTLSNLDKWHWVTVIAMEPDTMATDVCDQGAVLTIDLAEWLRTSILGGALIYLIISQTSAHAKLKI